MSGHYPDFALTVEWAASPVSETCMKPWFPLAFLILLAAPQFGAQDAPGLGIPPELAARKGPGGLSFAEAYKRTLIYHFGATQVFQRKMGMLLDAEVARRKARGEDLSWIRTDDEKVEARIRAGIEQLKKSDPDQDFWELLRSLGYDKESYRREVRRAILLEELFFPADPDHWPVHAKEIYGSGEEGSVYDTFLVDQLERMREAKAKGKAYKIDDTLKEMLLRPTIQEWLMGQAEIREPFDGLPEGTALQVGEQPVETDDLLARILPRIGPVERERAARWVETVWTVAGELERRGLLLSAEETLEIIAEEEEDYVDSPISYAQVVIEFQGFPTMEAYREFYRLRMSFRKSLPDPIPLEDLRADLEKRRAYFADGKVDAEVILCSAMNRDTGTFPRTGDPFAEAEKRIRAAAAELQEGSGWAQVREKFSDYKPLDPKAPQGAPQENKGRFGPTRRNPLLDFLGENDYTSFLLGNSFGDTLFFDAGPGRVYGPVRGPLGWYLYRVNGRQPPHLEIDLEKNERHRFLVEDDYLTLKFNRFVDQVMGAAAPR
ncbi:MAG: hypothetical protein ACE5H3_00055 [Planctomycetota bacterium]